VRETTHVLDMGASTNVGAMTENVEVPWLQEHRPAAQVGPVWRGRTEPAARVVEDGPKAAAPRGASVQARPARRSLLAHSFVSISGAILAAALSAQLAGAPEDGAPAEPVTAGATTALQAERRPASEDVDAFGDEVEVPRMRGSVEPVPTTSASVPVDAALAPDSPSSTLEAGAEVAIVAEVRPPIEPADVSPPPPAERPAAAPTRRKPAPHVPVTLVLFLLDAAEIQIGREVSRIIKKTEIQVPVGTHRVRWRLPGESDWRDAGRNRFEPRHGYVVRLRSSGAEIIGVEEGRAP
jgi:hypothetical protein